MTKTKRNIIELVRLTNRLKEMEIVHEQLRDMVNEHYYGDTSKLGLVIDNMVDEARKFANMIEDEIIEIETKLGF